MTYHSGMQGKLVGFGATLSPEDTVLAYATATGCTGMLPKGCFDQHMAITKAQCSAGLPPPEGATQYWWNAFCNKLRTCGLPPMCASDEADAATKIQKCNDATALATLAYIARYPVAADGTPSGPDRQLNALSVIAKLSPTLLAKMQALPSCDAPTPIMTPVPAPPPMQPAPPPPDYSAPVIADQTPVSVTSPEPDMTTLPDQTMQASATSSSGKYIVFGLLGAAVLGGAYFAFRKR